MPEERDLRCGISDAREICRRTAEHVEALCESSDNLLESRSRESGPDSLRSAFVLTLLALEETGKLFRIWQTAAGAEEQRSDLVFVKDLFWNHQAKGGLAGDLCCQMLDYACRSLESNPGTVSRFHAHLEALTRAKDHLKETYENFKSARECAMYTANDQGSSWHEIESRVEKNIEMENLLLELVASGAKGYLESDGRFSLATKGLLDTQKGIKSDESFAFAARMVYGLARLSDKERKEV
jgi:AbiV family abortive infection protein